MLLLYFCLFVDNVNKLIIFVFGAFVYHFKNIISIFKFLFDGSHLKLKILYWGESITRIHA